MTGSGRGGLARLRCHRGHVRGEEVDGLADALEGDVAADALRLEDDAGAADVAGVAAVDGDRLVLLDLLAQGAAGRRDAVVVLDVEGEGRQLRAAEPRSPARNLVQALI